MIENITSNYPIDVVLLWVDGKDPLHQKKMRSFIEDKSKLNNKNFITRFDQVEEIEYSINSILKFAPYVRNIFLVTDNQKPNFLKTDKFNEKYKKVVIIDHKEIFLGFENYLPTFNSISIETMIMNIPGLSEHFIYFNDDFFLINETKPEMFFKNGNPILRGKWTKYDSDIRYKVLYNRLLVFFGKKNKKEVFGFKRAQQNIARKLGFKKYFKFDHTPAPLRKSTILKYFEENPDMCLLNVKHRFRHIEQYTLQGLYNHIEIQKDTCELKYNLQLLYFGSYRKSLLWYKTNLNQIKSDKLFLTLQSLDLCPKDKLAFILGWLKKRTS